MFSIPEQLAFIEGIEFITGMEYGEIPRRHFNKETPFEGEVVIRQGFEALGVDLSADGDYLICVFG